MVYKEIQGTGNKVVLLHGWGCDHRYMQPIIDILATNHQIMNVDLSGRGQSIWHDSLNDIDDIADYLLPHLPEQAIYISWSFGGLITFSIASRYPHGVKRIVGVCTTPRFVETKDWPGVAYPGFKALFETISSIGYQAFTQAFIDDEFADIGTVSTQYNQLIQLLKDTANDDVAVLFKGINICDSTDLRSSFSQLTCPIDLLFGEADSAIPTNAHHHISQLNPQAKLHIIPGAKHMPFWTHPNLFACLLQEIMMNVSVTLC